MGWLRKGRKRRTLLCDIRNESGEFIGSCLIDSNHPILRTHQDLVYFNLHFDTRPLPSPEDFDTFDEVQSKIDSLCEPLEFCQPAIFTSEGKRSWILYCRDGKELMAKLNAELGKYSPEMECQHDPKWRQYKDLRSMVRK